MPVLDANGETIHYLKEGSGPVVVLIHSLGLSAQMWREQIAALKDRYTVVAFDTRGHGQSSAKGEVSVAAAAQDLKALLDHLGAPQCHLVAHRGRRSDRADVCGSTPGDGAFAGACGYVRAADRRQRPDRRGDRGSDCVCIDGGIRHAIRGRNLAAVDVS